MNKKQIASWKAKIKLLREYSDGFEARDGFNLRRLQGLSDTDKARINRRFRVVSDTLDNLSSAVKEMREVSTGFESRDGFNLRQKKKIPRRDLKKLIAYRSDYYALLGSYQSAQLYAPSSKKELQVLKETMFRDNEHMRNEFKVLPIQRPSDYVEYDVSAETSGNVLLQRKGLNKLIVPVDAQAFIDNDVEYVAMLLAQHPGESYSLLTGSYEMQTSMTNQVMLTPEQLLRELSKLISKYGSEGMTEWLTAINIYSFDNKRAKTNFLKGLAKRPTLKKKAVKKKAKKKVVKRKRKVRVKKK